MNFVESKMNEYLVIDLSFWPRISGVLLTPPRLMSSTLNFVIIEMNTR